ncbi:uncharacterized protein SAPINGB_P005129 [Magnusiomyces paraingens]|uniref:CS domain-containing protein n=1 Tax=Magnusiomyces paraingens TaxID=2606893 RepID=A0A5E8BZI4_9ASCO|nr:uncharacterized protein SAPINGB_P005129 [Saprochaete ingens]VVT56522.1 unnamed protein product [Saprochaete ingens]
MPSHPEVFWAQRSSATEPEKNVLYVTIAAEDITKPHLELTPTSFHFFGESEEGKNYDLTVELYEEIDPSLSKFTHTDRHTYAILRKAKAQQEYWPRLTKEKKKVFYIRTDFDKWVDEDEQDEQPEQNDDFGGMGGMGGMGGGNDAGFGGADLQSMLSGMGGGAGGMPDFSSLGQIPGLGSGANDDLMESLAQDASAQGKDFSEFAKQYKAKDSDDVSIQTSHLGNEEDEEDDDETPKEKNL